VLGDLSLQLQGAFASDPLPVWAPINWREQRGTLISAGMHLLVLALIAAVPPDSFALTADTFDTSFRFAPTLTQPLEDKDAPWLRKPADGGSRGGKQAAKERGKMGDPKVNKRKRGAYDMKGSDARNQPLGEIVKNIGVLGAINSARSTTLALILDPNQHAMSAGTEQVLGGLIGDQIGPEYGSHGLALDGTGNGGGCADGNCGLVGEGGDLGDRIGPRDGGPGWRGGWGKGKGPGGGKYRPRAPSVGVGVAKLRGALSKEIIRRIVRRHINEVRFCYQKQLQSNRDLRGRLIVNFVIAANGTVAMSRVGESTLSDDAVESCVASAVRRWAFPKPEGGGIVTVAYPFTFHAAGSGS
jgi:TonB family protein